tara:strand:- start:1553 stop:2587 length:1035 start_codon:yes stop_codon:yes gene_type:complete
MPNVSNSLSEIVNDPLRLVHRYDETNDQFRYVTVPRALHRQSAFLTDEHFPDNIETVALQREDTLPYCRPRSPLHFIFHSGYCCSTMLARAFDIEGIAMGLKEPVILNDMIGWRRRGGHPPKIAEVLDQSMNWLSKPLVEGESVIVKPSNIVNSLAIAILAMRPEARALLIHAPLKTYLQSIAKKDLSGRLWVRTLLIGQIKDQMIGQFGMSQEEILQLTDLQVAALTWLAQQAQFSTIIERVGSERVKSLNSEIFLANRQGAMRNLFELFQLNVNEAKLQEVLEGPAFTRHSKLNQEFDSASREQEHTSAATIHADEIEKVAHWADILADRMNIPMTLGSPLL